MTLPAMLSDEAVALIAKVPYKPNAASGVNILPFGSIFWTDEMPAPADLLDKPDDAQIIYRIFGIRLKIWDGIMLETDEQELWDAIRAQVPHWALFQRLSLSDQQRLAREEAERQVEQEFISLSQEFRSDSSDPTG